jgi:predicted nucleic acid-binding protein
MTLTDAGPLVALVDGDEPDHESCRDTLDRLQLPLLTTWPAFTEAMYLLGEAGGWDAQKALWHLVLGGDLEVESLSDQALKRSASLMEKYADRPMDLADATLVSLAEERNLRRIFTLDSDFHFFTLKGRLHFEVVPR